jgi:hypothetical protein
MGLDTRAVRFHTTLDAVKQDASDPFVPWVGGAAFSMEPATSGNVCPQATLAQGSSTLQKVLPGS